MSDFFSDQGVYFHLLLVGWLVLVLACLVNVCEILLTQLLLANNVQGPTITCNTVDSKSAGFIVTDFQFGLVYGLFEAV